MTEACDVIPVPEFTPEYTPKGTLSTFNDRSLYTVGSTESTTALVCIYDIFGFHKNTFQGTDFLALNTASAPLVIMPDFFKGNPLDATRLNDIEYRSSWIAARNDVDNLAYLDSVLEFIKKTYPAVKSIGLYGFCWGAKIAITAAKNKLVTAISLIHPSRLVELDAEGIEDIPVQIIATKDESDESLQPLISKLKNVEYIRMDDMFHGFAAARGDWSVVEQKERAQEAFKLTADFFARVL
ncbi:Alpha/Beta hydrolase protein [Kockiozyma suomiensis]|uniref:Alpha/Beta hydrolase protein n=1 Tax=Kockiozyma suomiensis TaxID=1337062 RepID=UPI003343E9E4